MLHSSQADLADRFARPSASDTWQAAAHRSVEDIPCVVVGHVIDLARAGSADAEPLLFSDRAGRSEVPVDAGG